MIKIYSETEYPVLGKAFLYHIYEDDKLLGKFFYNREKGILGLFDVAYKAIEEEIIERVEKRNEVIKSQSVQHAYTPAE